jgi:hypothetical protein
MRIRLVSLIAALATVVGLSFPLLAQAPAPAQKPPAIQAKNAESFDPHDLSGYWQFFIGIPGQGIYATPSKEGPPGMTAWGKEHFEANVPSYGPRTAQFDNDPIQHCRPTGIPRILFYPQPFEIVQTPGRVLMFFEREHERRDIWMDGRGHPPDVEPMWMGHSIGKWDGDTFVVDSVGFNDRTWLDFYGYPRSESLHLIERYRRKERTTLTLQFTVDDPKAYTGKWESDTKLYKLLTGDRAMMEELPCVAEEEEAFTNKVRNPARGVTGTAQPK